MFDFNQIIEFIKSGSDAKHGMLQSVLLFMIWITSRGLKKELNALRETFSAAQLALSQRFKNLEDRILVLEQKNK